MPNCEKKLINLYSSTNFTNPVDSKIFGKWDIDSKLKTLIHFVGEYSTVNQPNIYFKAKVTLDATVDSLGAVTKSNVVVKEICFKNEFNVSASSLTDEYKYLYNISCSSADNASSKSSKSSKSSSSCCSSELSLSEIYANGIEKQIMDNVKAFIEGNAFSITWVIEEGYYTLDTTQYNLGATFPNVKMTIKSKLIGSSSCSSHSSSSSCSHKPNSFVKTLVIGFIALIVVMCLLKFLKNKNYGGYSKLYDGVNNDVNNIFSKASGLFKSLFNKIGYNQKPYENKYEPVVEEQVAEESDVENK